MPTKIDQKEERPIVERRPVDIAVPLSNVLIPFDLSVFGSGSIRSALPADQPGF